MPSWYLKAAIQGGLSLLPQSQRWNYFLQRYISKNLRLRPSYFEKKLQLCTQHIDHYYHHRDTAPAKIIELGTGWLPIVPLGLALSGHADIISVDLNPLLRDQLVKETLTFFVQYDADSHLKTHLPHLKDERVKQLHKAFEEIDQIGAEDALALMGITYIVGDARSVQLGNIDLMVSNNTLEHIPGHIIEEIFQNFHTMLGNTGLMSHLIDLSDHYSHFDREITPYNFLQFSPERWKWYNNKLHYQNRLRASDYHAIHHRAGFEILSETHNVKSIVDLERVTLAPEYDSYTPEDLAVTSSWVVSRPQ